MANFIKYIPYTNDDIFLKCLGCGSERIEAFQCDCGAKFCRSCSPESFKSDEYGDSVEVTCPKCGAKTLFV